MSALVSQALQQALIAATRDEGERWRAITALRGAEVYAATWSGDPTQLRTLVDPDGVRALAVFTDERHVEEAALRLAWVGIDGAVAMRRLHLSDAIRFARAEDIPIVVVDVGSDHSLELDPGDMELVSAPPSTRPGSYGSLAPVLSSRTDDGSAVTRVSSRPPPTRVDPESSIPPPSALRPTAVNVDVAHHAISATFVPSGLVTMTPLDAPPTDDVAEALAQVLRDYLAVDWACLVADADQPDPTAYSVALRIDPAYRQQLPEIRERLREASAGFGPACELVVLETAEQMKRARQIGLPFYPWRRR
ncbi:MAG: SseB family protein [Polyangiales bacterium]